MSYNVYIERARDATDAGRAKLASAIAAKFRLPEATVRQSLEKGRLRVKSNVEEAAARAFARNLEALGAVTAVSDAATGAPLGGEPAATPAATPAKPAAAAVVKPAATPARPTVKPAPAPAQPALAPVSAPPPAAAPVSAAPPVSAPTEPAPAAPAERPKYESGLSAATSGGSQNPSALGALSEFDPSALTIGSLDGTGDSAPAGVDSPISAAPPPPPTATGADEGISIDGPAHDPFTKAPSAAPPSPASTAPAPAASAAPEVKKDDFAPPGGTFAPPADEEDLELAIPVKKKPAAPAAAAEPLVEPAAPAPAPAPPAKPAGPPLGERLRKLGRNPSARVAAGFVLALAIGYVPAEIYAQVAEGRYDVIRRDFERAPRPATLEEWRSLDERLATEVRPQLASTKRRARLMFGVIWVVVGVAVGFGWNRFLKSKE